MIAFGLLGLLACGDKETEDTAVEDVVESEDTGLEETEETQDTDTEETDTDETDTEDPEELDSAFPELLGPLLDRIDNAMPAPILSESPDNTTTMGLMTVSFGPMAEVQMMASDPSMVVTCPEIDGEFPSEGLPTEPITVTGNGCTNEVGATYNGSFVYSEDGIVYDNYEVISPVESCDGLMSSAMYNGGTYIDFGFTGIEFESVFQGTIEEVDYTNCATVPSQFQYHLEAEVAFQDDDAQLINGEAEVLVVIEGVDYTFAVQTVDEMVDEAQCASEPVSGTNTVSNGVDELVFTFDGATDCDEEPTQMLSINGGQATEVAGASCSNAPVRSTVMWMVGLVSMLTLRRRV